MVDLKRNYVVPLRRKTKTAPRWRRTKKAVRVLKEFVAKHMKCDNVLVCAELNIHLWKKGAKNPPGKVEVVCLKTTINNSEKVLVNLSSVGIDSQLNLYPQSIEKDEKKEIKDKKVVDVEIKEKTVEESLVPKNEEIKK
jgi:large subunit ribosomal protein L31e